jgi:flagellin-like protein
MKKMWKMRKNREAVSPVIATILMVAITVVLAAVLYVMVMGFGTGPGTTATGALSVTDKSTTTATIQLTSISKNDVGNDTVEVIVSGGAYTAGSAVLMPVPSGRSATAPIAVGYYIHLTGLTTGTTYTVMIRDLGTLNSIASTTFATL